MNHLWSAIFRDFEVPSTSIQIAAQLHNTLIIILNTLRREGSPPSQIGCLIVKTQPPGNLRCNVLTNSDLSHSFSYASNLIAII